MTPYACSDIHEAIYEMHADEIPGCTCVHCDWHRARSAQYEDLQELLGNKQYRVLPSDDGMVV